jgi:uncharacterized membrane protein YhhN
MPLSLIWLALIAAFIDWFAVVRQWKSLEYIAKPAVIIILIAWLGLIVGIHGNIIWFLLGLVYSLFGDIFLMLPKERLIFGLIAFLLAHLAFTLGFYDKLPPISVPGLIVVILVAVPAAQLYRRISEGLLTKGYTELRRPVLVYTIVTGCMLVSALWTLVRPESSWKTFPALLVSSGALLFFISDSLIAWNRFVTSLPNGRLKGMITYHLAQIAIVLGAAINFSQDLFD